MSCGKLLVVAGRLAVLLVLAGALGAGVRFAQRGGQPRVLDTKGWSIERLVEHLNSRGLSVRAISTMKNRQSLNNAYLATSSMDFEDVNSLQKVWRTPSWQGVVYCETGCFAELHSEGVAGGKVLELGGFRFYGDEELMDRIVEALLQQD
jgi:hypothetical protein